MRKIIQYLFLLCLIAASGRGFSQQPAAQEEGTKAFGSYSGDDIESVSTENGKLVLHIPLYSAPQRGQLKVSFSLMYSNAAYTTTETCVPHGECESRVNANPEPGVVSVFDQYYYVRLTNTATSVSGGGTLAYNAYDVVGPDGSINNLGYSSGVYHSVDGTGFLYTPPASDTTPWEAGPSDFSVVSSPGTLTDANGTQYTFAPVSGTDAGQLTTITDADGNYLSIPASSYMSSITDSLGRTIPYPPGQQTTTATSGCPVITASYQTLSGSATWSVPGYGGTQTYLFCFANVPVSTGEDSIIEHDFQYHNTLSELQSVVLPDGTWWGFVYDAANPDVESSTGYGDLVQLIYPTTGSTSYSWAFNAINPWICSLRDPPFPGPRGIQTRTLNSNAVSGEWSYAYNIVENGSTKYPTTTITDPNGDQIVSTFQDFSSDGQCNLYETQRLYSQIQSGSLSPIEKVQTFYQAYQGYDTRGYAVAWPTAMDTEWPDEQASYSSYTYDTGVTDSGYTCLWADGSPTCSVTNSGSIPFGKKVQQYDYDYSGTLLRQTQTSYLWQSNGSYLTANLLNTPSSVTVSNASSQVAQTNYTYDESSKVRLTPTASVSEQIGDPPATVYGHLTTTTGWLSSGTNPASSTYWLNTGEVDHTVDPKGNTTSFTYSSTYYGAFPTLTTNTLGQSSSSAYDFNTGLPTSTTDPNGQATTYAYDGMNRITSINYPDGGEATYAYNASGYPANSVLATKLMCQGSYCSGGTGQTESSLSVYDGLGRIAETELLSDPVAPDLTLTSYDALGRVASVTNPYRTTSDPTYGSTTYQYDMLDRMTSLIHVPDGSSQQWSYTGSQVDFLDEASNHWQRVSDGLGRLTKVLEPNSSDSPTIETDYQYDALSNLTRVDQWGGSSGGSGDHVRTFTYDGLSRLLTGANPEAGTTTYTYDLNGNVATRTDARSIVTTYSYDGLNRLTGKSYSDGVTPSVSIAYDTASAYANPVNGSNNFKGRVSSESTAVGSTVVSNKYISGYDSMGRETGYIECGYAGSCSSTSGEVAFSADYYYDLAGDVTTLNTGIGQLAELYPENSDQTAYRYFTYDTAGRLSSTDSSLDVSPGDENYQVSTYGPVGMTAAAYVDDSNNPLVGIARTYDSRLRLASETDTDTSDSSTLYSYSLGFASNSNVTSMTDLAMGAWSFGYDNLNRLTSGTTSSGAYSGLTENWSYDNFGNRLTETPSGSPSIGVPEGATVTYSVSNQVATSTTAPSGYSYDAAGNVTNDGGNQYLYDGEGRLCAVYAYGAFGGMTQYVYDAEGDRVAKWAITSFSCDITSNGYSPSNVFILGQSGEQLDETDGLGNELHSNTFGSGRLLYTYDANFTEWGAALSDWLGTKRIQVDPDTVTNLTTFTSLPFGNGLTSNGYGEDSTEHHYTGKVHDWESGNDYFGARYYGSSMGRFTSPDPSSGYYANIANPQSLNLYSYALNNPLTNVDPTGLYCFYGGQGDTVENDSDPSDYDFTSDGPGECGNTGGQWIDNPSSTVTVSAGGNNGNVLSTFPSDISQNYQFIPGKGCSTALTTAGATSSAINNYYNLYQTPISNGASANGVEPHLLGSVGVRESGLPSDSAVIQRNGLGRGLFQIDLGAHPGVTAAQAFDASFSANYAANILSTNMATLAAANPNFSAAQLTQATAASYNFGTGNISGNPNTIDVGTTDGNYGSNVVAISVDCF